MGRNCRRAEGKAKAISTLNLSEKTPFTPVSILSTLSVEFKTGEGRNRASSKLISQRPSCPILGIALHSPWRISP
jgi:hypothetical protein